jgi:hypothetical protein
MAGCGATHHYAGEPAHQIRAANIAVSRSGNHGGRSLGVGSVGIISYVHSHDGSMRVSSRSLYNLYGVSVPCNTIPTDRPSLYYDLKSAKCHKEPARAATLMLAEWR